MNFSTAPAVLLYVEAEAYVDNIQTFSFEKIGTILWWNQHRQIEQLTMQAVTNASANEDEFVKELLLLYNKIPILIHELIVMEIWKQKLLKIMFKIHEDEDDANPSILAVSIALRHEANLVTLLETILFHGDCCESLKDVIVEVADYCHRRIVHLINICQENKSETEDPPTTDSLMSQTTQEDVQRQEEESQFQIDLKCISILRYICDNLDNLPFSLTPRFLDTYDFPLLMVAIMEESPWIRTKKNKEGKLIRMMYENGGWQPVLSQNTLKIGKIEAQVWMVMLRLLVGTENKYEVTNMRKNRLVKLRPLLSEVKMDQIPALAMLVRFLDMISFSETGPAKRNVLIEQVPELWTQLMSDGEKKGWKKIARTLTTRFFNDDQVKEQIKHWATVYDPTIWEHLLPDAPKCASCGKEAHKRCSKCKNEWYCGRSTTKQLMSLQDLLNETRLKLLELHFTQLESEDISVTLTQFACMISNVLDSDYNKKELELIFNKIDSMSKGYIDWNCFISYIASEMQMREHILSISEGTIESTFRTIKPGHQDTVCAIDIMPYLSPDVSSVDYYTGRYITASKDGCIRVWSQQWQLLKSKQCLSEWSQRKKNTWMLHMTCMPNTLIIAVATVNESIDFYDYTSNKMDLVCSLCEIGAIVTCLHYWYTPTRLEEGCLTFGDSSGNVTHLHFIDCLENRLFGLPQTYRNIQRVPFAEVLNNKIKFVKALQFAPMHEEWVKQVCYVPLLKSIISCSINSNYSMILQSTVLDQSRRIFAINKGINCFDYNDKLGVIATGGIDRCLRIWNPFINRRCMATFYGHSTPITHVVIIDEADQVLSLSTDKSLKVWDLKDETCVQSLFGKLIPTGPYPITCFFHNKLKRQIVLATSHVITIDRIWDAGGHDLMNFLTHPKPLVGVLYSEIYNEVITGCEQGIIIFWRLDTGQKSFQITNAHSVRLDGIITGVEITAMALDAFKRALITAGHDNLLKMWNLSNGTLLRSLDVPNLLQVNVILPTMKNIYYAGWNRRVFRTNTNMDKDSVKLWPIRHDDDILDMAYLEPNILITCSWDGRTKLWVLELGVVKNTYSLFYYFSEKNLTFMLSGTGIFRSESLRSSWKSVKYLSPSLTSDSGSLKSGKHKLKIGPKILAKYSALYQMRQNPPGLTCMLVLAKRKPNKVTGNLFLANINGIIEVWSTHLSGEPLAVFTGVTTSNHFVTCMATDPKNNYLLFTGDSFGYIRVWYLRYFHNAAEPITPTDQNDKEVADFPFMRSAFTHLAAKVKNDFAKFKPYEFSESLDIEHPFILTSFRAHLSTIKKIIYVPERKLLLSASSDQSVRLWTETGKYLATFGDNRGWNLNDLLMKRLSKPFERTAPYDIRQHGSAVSLQVEMDGIGKRWQKLRYLFYYLYVKAVMRRKLPKTRLEVAKIKTPRGSTVENLQKLKKEQELLQLGSPIGNLFEFKKCPKRMLKLPKQNTFKGAVYANMINADVQPIHLEEILNSLNQENYIKLKYKRKASSAATHIPLK
uniref:WD repeat-containing protein on Y chromosome n=1 Tax=Strigamia maritima TaxID=126957 RepID=T1J7X5_STRMM